MSHQTFEPGILSDIAASLFAVLLLIVMLMLGQIATTLRGVPQASVRSVLNVEIDLDVIEREVVSPTSMIEQLYHRVHAGAGRDVQIDLHQDRLEIVSGQGREPIVWRPTSGEGLEAMLRASLAEGRSQTSISVSLFIFSSAFYHRVRRVLRGTGHAVSEISVPRALRSVTAEQVGERWSAAFLALDHRTASRDEFRESLAEILSGGTRSATARTGRNMSTSGSLLTRLRSGIAVVLTWPALLAAACVMVVAESLSINL